MSELGNIWKGGDGGDHTLTEAQLMAYLEGRLSPEERHDIEALLSHDGPESDALEGLQQLSSEEARSMKLRLHRDLQKTLHKKRRKRRALPEQRWAWLAIGIILLLAIVCYALLHMARLHLK